MRKSKIQHNLEYHFDLFNSRYFKFGQNKLQSLIGIEWSDLDNHNPPLMGRVVSYRTLYKAGKKLPDSLANDRFKIQISKSDQKHPRVWKMTLLHEMVHFALNGKDKSRLSCGSRMFQAEMKRLANAGAFNGLW